MAKDPTYPMYAQDFDMDTSYWSLTEIGAFVRLLNACWINNGIPNDQKKLSRICRISEDEFSKLWSETLKGEFFLKENILKNKRQEEVRKYRNTQRNNGKKGGRKKKVKQTQTLTETKPNEKVSNEIEIEIEIETKNGNKKKKVPSKEILYPTKQEFLNHAKLKAQELEINIDEMKVNSKFIAWSENNWRTLGNKPRKIKNWKSTLVNSLQYCVSEGSSNENFNPLSS